MEKRIRLLPVILVLTVLSTSRPSPQGIAAAVVPVDPSQELYESIRSAKKTVHSLRTRKSMVSAIESEAVLIVGHKKGRPKKVFSAAQFVCGLPIKLGTFTTVCKEPKDAEAAVKKMKEQGFDEIRLKTPASGEIYDAIVRSARVLDIRINA